MFIVITYTSQVQICGYYKQASESTIAIQEQHLMAKAARNRMYLGLHISKHFKQQCVPIVVMIIDTIWFVLRYVYRIISASIHHMAKKYTKNQLSYTCLLCQNLSTISRNSFDRHRCPMIKTISMFEHPSSSRRPLYHKTNKLCFRDAFNYRGCALGSIWYCIITYQIRYIILLILFHSPILRTLVVHSHMFYEAKCSWLWPGDNCLSIYFFTKRYVDDCVHCR